MAVLVVPPIDPSIPTLGPQVAQFIEERLIFGPGSLRDQPAKLDPEKVGLLYRIYEVHPPGHRLAGRRLYNRCGIELRKGLAKCLAPDTPVSMADGTLRLACELRPGDVVLGYDEQSRRLMPAVVSGVEEQLPAPMVRVTTDHGRQITVTAEHPVLTRGTLWREGMPSRWRWPSCDPRSSDEQWTKACELRPGDRIVVGLGGVGGAPVDPELAWIVGAFCGDGSGKGRFTSADPEIVERIARTFAVTKCKGDYNYYVCGSADMLREFGMFDSNSKTKHVPAQIMRADRDSVLAFLAGYLDTDGWVSYSRRGNRKVHKEIAWGSVNRDLLVECQHLLARIGINGTVCRSVTAYNGVRHQSWNLAVRDAVQARQLAEMLLPYATHAKKRDRLAQIAAHEERAPFGQRDCDKVVAVEYLPPAVSIAVEVAGVHTHVTGGIVTHNTEFAAWIAICELHPEAPVRCDGFDARGNPVGRPVRSPYIPMMAVTEGQVEELAYGVVKYILENCADADLFDISKDRIVRLGANGSNDGELVAVSNAPGSRDGARTTFQHFDEPHRLFMPRHRDAHETMLQNLHKRQLEDPWTLYTSTAGQPGQGSIQESLRSEAEKIANGDVSDPTLFFFSRWAGDDHDDLSTLEKRIAAVADATGPVGEWGAGQFERIARDYDREDVDKAYWERVWLNRWRQSGSQGFNMRKVEALCVDGVIPDGAFVGVGFDGSRYNDATALVVTDLETGRQVCAGVWEHPENVDEWEVPEDEVTEQVAELMDRFDVWRLYADPYYWTAAIAGWAERWPDRVVEWSTARKRAMAEACAAFDEAVESGAVSFGAGPFRDVLLRHMGNAARRYLTITDDKGQQLWVLQKREGRLADKIDASVAAVLSWRVFLDAKREGARPRPKSWMPRRLY